MPETFEAGWITARCSATTDCGDFLKRLSASAGGMSAFSTEAVVARKCFDGARSSLANP